MGKKSVEMLVGIFVLLGMAGLVFLALKAANLGTFSSGDTYMLRAYADDGILFDTADVTITVR